MAKLQHMTYTKANGEESRREVIVVSKPRKNFLMYDVTTLTEKQLDILLDVLSKIEDFRENALADFELLSEVKESDLWRSFKPEGIEWWNEDD